jgi:hypothetical protein
MQDKDGTILCVRGPEKADATVLEDIKPKKTNSSDDDSN